MKRLACLLVAGVAAMTAFGVYADPPAGPGDDPPLLKKKSAPDLQDPPPPPAAGDNKDDKDKDKKPADALKPDADKGDGPEKPRQDPDEVLKGVAKSMRSVQERLAHKEINDATRQAEDDALKGLDSLIDLTQNPPDQQEDQNSSSDSASSKPDSSKSPDQSKSSSDPSKSGASKSGQSGLSPSPSSSSGRTGKGRRTTRRSQASRGGRQGAGSASADQKQPGSQGDKQSQASADKPSDTGGAGGGTGKDGQPPKDANADLYKNVWGHLPETLRAEMNAYSNTKGFMPEYESLISRYYSTIAEQGRRKGD